MLGSLLGEWLGINDRLGDLWFWLGHQGSEYLDLGRFWQVLLAVGLVLWLVLMFRALRPAMKAAGRSELASLFLYSAAAIPIFYLPALFYGPHTNFAVIDNWRFWIIHLWVEGFFELFATVLVATMFHQMGLVSVDDSDARRLPRRDPVPRGRDHRHRPPLVLHGSGNAQHGSGLGLLGDGGRAADAPDPRCLGLRPHQGPSVRRVRLDSFAGGQIWAIYFLMAVGFWNFVGAGVFGFLINLPIVSYFEVGTLLTSNHGHAAMFGVFGMLALAVLVFCLRAMQTDAVWLGTVEVTSGSGSGGSTRVSRSWSSRTCSRAACCSSGTR